MIFLRVALCGALLALLSACGGGGSDAGAAGPATLQFDQGNWDEGRWG